MYLVDLTKYFVDEGEIDDDGKRLEGKNIHETNRANISRVLQDGSINEKAFHLPSLKCIFTNYALILFDVHHESSAMNKHLQHHPSSASAGSSPRYQD